MSQIVKAAVIMRLGQEAVITGGSEESAEPVMILQKKHDRRRSCSNVEFMPF